MLVEVKVSLDLGNNDWRSATVGLDNDDLLDICREENLPHALLTVSERNFLLRTKAEILVFKEMHRLGANIAKAEEEKSQRTYDAAIVQLSKGKKE